MQKNCESGENQIETIESMVLMSASAIEGTDAGEWVNGDANDNKISAGGGDDEIYAPLGNNEIDGGSGEDVLIVYGSRKADYDIESIGNGSFRVRGQNFNGQEVVNTLQNVEAILFDDGVVELDSAADHRMSNKAMAVDEIDIPPLETFVEVREPAEESSAQPVEEAKESAPVPVEEQFDEPVEAVQPFAQVAPVEDNFIGRVIELTNQIRRQYGLNDLTSNSELQQAAQFHSQNMANQDFFSHTGIDGSLPWERGTDAGYEYRSYGENIAAGQRTPEEVVQAWANSPSHLANIVNPDFTEIGVGYAFLQNDFGNVNYRHYWSQEFGTPR